MKKFNAKITGDFVPYLKFNGKSGRWYTKNEAGEEHEVTVMTAIFDLHNIKFGWLCFNEGQAPDHVWDDGDLLAPKPSEKHKRGFSVNCFSPKNLGGLREFSASSNVSKTAVKDLYEQFCEKPEARQGLVPVVKCERIIPIKSKFGTNYRPVLTIVRWVDRPAELGELATKLESEAEEELPDGPREYLEDTPLPASEEDYGAVAVDY